MKPNHAAAIVRWRDELEQFGLDIQTQPSATISTMLFGCNRWLENNAGPGDQFDRIMMIKAELERWLSARGLTFNG